MDTSLVPSEKKSILYPAGYEGKYASFEVGYIGDKAGVRFAFVNAVHSTGIQHLKDAKKAFEVVTVSDSFSLEGLKAKLSGDLKEEDKQVLNDGYRALEDFIFRNGVTNPASVEDFECSPA